GAARRPAAPARRRRTRSSRGRRFSSRVWLLAQGAHRLLALVARGAVEDEHAVQVVDLVLDDARLQPAGLDLDRLAVLVARAAADVDRALHVDDHAGQRQAPLLHDLGPLATPLTDRADARDARGLAR